jgi:hypothetical protein
MDLPANPIKSNKAINALAKGMSERDTAKLINVSRGSIQGLKAKPEIKAKIERIQKELADKTLDQIMRIDQGILDTTQEFVEGKDIDQNGNKTGIDKANPSDYQEVSVLMSQYRKLSSGILKALGILPSPAQSIFVQNLYQDNRNQVLSSGMVDMLGNAMSDQLDDILDIEPEDEG